MVLPVQRTGAHEGPSKYGEALCVHARREKQHYDELCEDARLSDPDSHFRVNVFNARLDTIINQLLQSFVALRETTKLFQAIHPSELKSASDDVLYEHAQRLADHSNRDLSPCFLSQLHAFRACFKTEFVMQQHLGCWRGAQRKVLKNM